MSQRQQKRNNYSVPQRFPREAAAIIVKDINQTQEGYVTVKNLFRPKLNIFSVKDVEAFIQRYENNFTLRGNNIWVTTSLKLCEAHCRKRQNCDETCGSLHVCRNFILNGEQACYFNKGGKTCMFGHDLHTNFHNQRLLKIHNLDYLNDSELRVLLKRRTCRSFSTLPQICLYYNDKSGNKCSNKHCKSLHFCMDHLRGVCLGGPICQREHRLRHTKQNRMVLNLFAIDETWTENTLLEDLKQVMEQRRWTDTSSCYCSSHGSVSDIDEIVSNCSETSCEESINPPLYKTNDVPYKETVDPPSYKDLCASRSPNSKDEQAPCCRECKENKELIRQLSSRIISLERKILMTQASPSVTPQL